MINKNDLQTEQPSATELAAKCWYLTGATASGKTAVSLELADLLDAEIISLDSMAIYRGMDIGTAKPSSDIRLRTPHHLIDILEPDQSYSVSQYRETALAKIQEILARGRQVLFVGGTALYLKALLRGMFEGPPADWEFRREVQQELDEMGAEFLHQRLEMIDPVSSHLLHPNDHRRIIRALEVYRTTGKPISHWQMQFDEGRRAEDCRAFTIRHPRPILHERIEQRVEQMFENGMVAEVQALKAKYTELSHSAMQAVGYAEVLAHLRGELTLAETIEKTKSRTRKFARHQETWFRGLSECRIIDLVQAMEPRRLAETILEIANN